MKKIVLVLLMLVLPCVAHAESEFRWIYSEDGKCAVYDQYGDGDYYLHWTGECVGGKADGWGIATIYTKDNQHKKIECKYEGNLSEGKYDGVAFLRWGNGNIATGHYLKGLRDGEFLLKDKPFSNTVSRQKYLNGKLVSDELISKKVDEQSVNSVRIPYYEKFVDYDKFEGPEGRNFDEDYFKATSYIKDGLAFKKGDIEGIFCDTVMYFLTFDQPHKAMSIHKIACKNIKDWETDWWILSAELYAKVGDLKRSEELCDLGVNDLKRHIEKNAQVPGTLIGVMEVLNSCGFHQKALILLQYCGHTVKALS